MAFSQTSLTVVRENPHFSGRSRAGTFADVDRRDMEACGASKKIAASSLAAIANGEKIQ
jgi:hypothetical protein